jgi:transcription antitermination protein NusB
MSARSKARRRALDILFETDVRGIALGSTLPDRVAKADPPLNPYVTDLVEGVITHQRRIDQLLGTYATGWTVDRMPAVDRNLLRIGVFEILYRDDVPDMVAIDEAVSIAKDLSTDESPAFVNGLLARISELKPELTHENDQPPLPPDSRP